LLNKNIRADWKDFITLYFEAHLASSILYQGTALSVRRARPLVYNTSLSLEVRAGHNASNSFFSGHTSSTATASFFMAKVYADYHQLTTGQKILLYAGAAIPPSVVGYYRMKGGKHFRTDVLAGFAVGCLTGVLVPELHRKKDGNLSFIPIYSPDMKGLAISLKL